MHENEVSEKIISAEIEAHRILGPGFLESVYEDSNKNPEGIVSYSRWLQPPESNGTQSLSPEGTTLRDTGATWDVH